MFTLLVGVVVHVENNITFVDVTRVLSAISHSRVPQV